MAIVPPYEDSGGGGDEEDPLQYGITPELTEFVLNICSHPNTFKDFPIAQLPSSTKLTPKQEKHAMFILKLVPELSKLRYKLCPVHMKDEMFWCVYFLLVFNKTGNILMDDNAKSTPTKQATHSHTPQDVEDYFDKLFVSQMAEISTVDDGIEPDDDNYFSPHKYKFRTITNIIRSEDIDQIDVMT